MMNETTIKYLSKKLRNPIKSKFNFEDISRPSGVRVGIQIGYIWQLFNLMASGLSTNGHTPRIADNNLEKIDYDGIDLMISLIAQEFYDNNEQFFSLNIMNDVLQAYEIHMDKVTLSLRLKKLVRTDYLEQVSFESLSSANQLLISDNNRIKIVYHLSPNQLKRFDVAYENSKENDNELTASASAPLYDFVKCMQFALLELPNEVKIEISDSLINSIKD